MQVIDHANRITDWHQNLGKDEVPPEWMWPFEDELKTWFEEVETARNAKYSTDGGDSGGEAMLGNEAAEEMKARHGRRG